jgi:hypothetical protein
MRLSTSWPDVARDVLIEAARYYYQQMREPFPVPDVAMTRAIEWANDELARRDRDIREEASRRWIDRWERGALDAEMRRAIEDTYRRLSRAERGISPRSAAKKGTRQLDVEIAQALAERRK